MSIPIDMSASSDTTGPSQRKSSSSIWIAVSLRHGFARIRCDQCHNEYLLAFSCKTRSFCPSCHAKRSAVFSEWVCDEVMEPVTHRHYVFSIPKILRIYFRYNRKLLGGLSRCAYETVKEMMQAAMGDNAAVPGMIAAIQTFGSDIDWHPHLHCLVTNGAFTPDGTFHAMEILSPSVIRRYSSIRYSGCCSKRD